MPKSFFGLAVIIAGIVVSNACGQFTYVTNGGTVTITSYSGSLTEVNFPSEIDGLPVTAIICSNFNTLTPNFALTEVSIPDTVTDIENAFYYCFNLFSVALPDSVTNVGYGAFAHSSLFHIDIPENVIGIGDYAFYNSYDGLTNVTFLGDVQTIGFRAFSGCNRLLNIVVPESVTNLGLAAFSDSEGGLTNISIGAANPYYSTRNGVLFDKRQTTLMQCPGGTKGAYVVPNGVGRIGPYAFEGCIFLSNITIPATVTNIGSNAFWNCNTLSNIYFAGDAPIAGSSVCSGTPATVRYLPGTHGWGDSFAGLPTAPWFLPYPVILPQSIGCDITQNHFGFTVSWATNAAVAIDTCSDLSAQAWTPAQTNEMVNGTFQFSDTNCAAGSCRFYRLRIP